MFWWAAPQYWWRSGGRLECTDHKLKALCSSFVNALCALVLRCHAILVTLSAYFICLPGSLPSHLWLCLHVTSWHNTRKKKRSGCNKVNAALWLKADFNYIELASHSNQFRLEFALSGFTTEMICVFTLIQFEWVTWCWRWRAVDSCAERKIEKCRRSQSSRKKVIME